MLGGNFLETPTVWSKIELSTKLKFDKTCVWKWLSDFFLFSTDTTSILLPTSVQHANGKETRLKSVLPKVGRLR